jgi:hypothetical protein
MATLNDGFGGGGGGSGGYGGGTGGQFGPLASQTYYADPNAAGGLIERLMQNMQQQQGNLNSFMANPTASPLFQGQLSGLLSALAPDEARGATQLQDVFRNAGNTSSSVFGDAAQNYQSGVQRNHQELASKLLGQSFQQIVSALLPQIQQGPQLLEAMRLSQSYRAPQQQSVSGGSSGGGTPSSSFGGSSPNNSLQQLLSALSGSGGGGVTPTTSAGPGPVDATSFGAGSGNSYYTPQEQPSFYNNYGQGWNTPNQFPASGGGMTAQPGDSASYGGQPLPEGTTYALDPNAFGGFGGGEV